MEPAFPFGPRATLTPALIDLAERQYGFGPARSSRDLGGTYNLNTLLRMAQGDFVLRVYRPWVTPQRLRGIQALKAHLGAAGIPAVPPLHTHGGEAYFRYEDRLAEVEPFVAHDGEADSWSRYGAAFALLGRLHSTRIDAQHLPSPLVANYQLPGALRAWVAKAHRLIAPTGDTQALALCDRANDLLQPIVHWWQTSGATLPQAFTHGDYGGGNLLFKDQHIVALVDFDFADVRERVFDIAYALYWMFLKLEPQVSLAQRSWQRIPEMLVGYDAASSQPLTSAERDAIQIEMARVPLYWVGEAAFLPDPRQAVLGCAEDLSCAEWIMAHTDVFKGQH